MKKNSIWFESPFPHPTTFNNPYPLKNEHQEPQELHLIKPVFFSPEPIPPLFRNFNALTPLSLWPKPNQPQPESKFGQYAGDRLISGENLKQEEINQMLIYSENEHEHVTPIKATNHGRPEAEIGWLATTGRKSEKESGLKRPRPREKGLRKLSQRAFEIVTEVKNATYKEVATKLLQQLSQEELEAENKEEQNIKRRVYDALNVLIALGVLKKDGRRIISERGNKKGGKTESIEPQEAQALRAKLMEKQNAVEEKRGKLFEAQFKCRAITTLLLRNKRFNFSMHQTIPFPFIGVCINSSDVKKIQKCRKEQFLLTSQDPFKPFGDIDSLKWLTGSLQRLSAAQQSEDFCLVKMQEIC